MRGEERGAVGRSKWIGKQKKKKEKKEEIEGKETGVQHRNIKQR